MANGDYLRVVAIRADRAAFQLVEILDTSDLHDAVKEVAGGRKHIVVRPAFRQVESEAAKALARASIIKAQPAIKHAALRKRKARAFNDCVFNLAHLRPFFGAALNALRSIKKYSVKEIPKAALSALISFRSSGVKNAVTALLVIEVVRELIFPFYREYMICGKKRFTKSFGRRILAS